MAELTGILQTIAEVAGEDAARKLARDRGGRRMKFSAAPKSVLSKIVGVEAAQKIVAELGREARTIPMADLRGRGRRQAAAARLLSEGMNAQQVAVATDIHERTARRIREKLKTGLPLFDRD